MDVCICILQKDDKGGEKKADASPITVVLKMDLHCEGCAKKVQSSVKHFEGTRSMTNSPKISKC